MHLFNSLQSLPGISLTFSWTSLYQHRLELRYLIYEIPRVVQRRECPWESLLKSGSYDAMMSTRSIELSSFCTSNKPEKLRLTCRNVAVLHMPPNLKSCSDKEILQRIMAGDICVLRAPHCRIIIAIYVDGQLAESAHWHSLYESIKTHLGDGLVSGKWVKSETLLTFLSC